MNQPGFKTRGFYLHACWKFNYPFAVRSWSRADYAGMFALLRALDLQRVMLWPMIETVPPPISAEDAAGLRAFRAIIADAASQGLECWVVSSPNLTSRAEIRSLPLSERHFYPYMQTYHLDQADQFAAWTAHLEQLLAQVNNADGYAIIDGDPGGYPGARPEDFLALLRALRPILERVGANPSAQKVVPWIWCGWGTDWGKDGPWKPELRPLVEPVLRLLKEQPLQEPWELMPGRSMREGWANGRINLALAEELGLIERSTLLTYEIIEYEPTQPAVVPQFEDIRRVLREEYRYAAQARGVFGNAQTPVMSLPNLFYFARCAADPACLNWDDQRVFAELAQFLGGPPDLLAAAWNCLRLAKPALDSDLPARLRASKLNGAPAAWIPGGPELYLDLMARFVEARLAVLDTLEDDRGRSPAERLGSAAAGLARWWAVHAYVFSGEGEAGFAWEWTHPQLWQPLAAWAKTCPELDGPARQTAASILAGTEIVSPGRAEALILELLR